MDEIKTAKILSIQKTQKHIKIILDYKIEFSPGDLIEVLQKDSQGNFKEPRPYTVNNQYPNENLELYIGIVEGGLYSEYFKTLKQGDCFYFKGPFENKLESRIESKNLFIIALGSGITTYRAFINQKRKDYNIVFNYANKNKEEAHFLEEFEKIENENLKVNGIFTDRQELLEELKEELNKFLEKNQEYNVLISGPPKAIENIQSFLKEHNVSEDKIIID